MDDTQLTEQHARSSGAVPNEGEELPPALAGTSQPWIPAVPSAFVAMQTTYAQSSDLSDNSSMTTLDPLINLPTRLFQRSTPLENQDNFPLTITSQSANFMTSPADTSLEPHRLPSVGEGDKA